MQSWADIASDSDDDSVGHHHAANQVPEPEPEPKEKEVVEAEEKEAPPPKEYDWPGEPPFTAYVGNLPYSIKDSSDLNQAIEDILQDRFQATVRIAQSRLAMDRQDNRPRGFGYLELDTVDDLKTVMRLNDGKSLLKGRPLKFDVASPSSALNNSRRSLNRSNSREASSRSHLSDIDGSSFRGGRYNRRDSSSSLRRQSSVSSETAETRQRPSLKLAPRSKPLDGQQKESSSSNLFGSGKARDDAEWERRLSEAKQEQRGSTSSTGGGGGRGGRGKGKGGGNKQQAGRGGRGGGRGGKDGPKKTQSQKTQPPKEKEADAVPKAVLKAPPTGEPAKPSTSKALNKFSALNMDSDSD